MANGSDLDLAPRAGAEQAAPAREVCEPSNPVPAEARWPLLASIAFAGAASLILWTLLVGGVSLIVRVFS